MRIALTGGGTGGHIYPALEVGREAAEGGAELLYFGSLRGQEGGICADLGIQFQGYKLEPLWSLKSVRGWKSLAATLRAVPFAKQHLKAAGIQLVFSTGGYSAGPVVAAARSLKIPYAIHAADSHTGRANLLFCKQAKSFTCTFYSTVTAHPEAKAVRTGQPIRKVLRDVVLELASHQPRIERDTILVTGGSQGSKAINELIAGAIPQFRQMPVRVLHVTGKGNLKAARQLCPDGDGYETAEFLSGDKMAAAYARAKVVICRSGGSISELALFGVPGVLIPLPTSADNHQHFNALEFSERGMATELPQLTATPESLTEAVSLWLKDEAKYAEAELALRAWDAPRATAEIVARMLR